MDNLPPNKKKLALKRGRITKLYQILKKKKNFGPQNRKNTKFNA